MVFKLNTFGFRKPTKHIIIYEFILDEHQLIGQIIINHHQLLESLLLLFSKTAEKIVFYLSFFFRVWDHKLSLLRDIDFIIITAWSSIHFIEFLERADQ